MPTLFSFRLPCCFYFKQWPQYNITTLSSSRGNFLNITIVTSVPPFISQNHGKENYNLLCDVQPRNYSVYVVELKKAVFTEDHRFRNANPQFNGVLECLYVGMTSKSPKERFLQHKTKYVSKKGYDLSVYIVYRYGTYLRPSLYEHINEKKLTRQEAILWERRLALDLRRKGYAVWFN